MIPTYQIVADGNDITALINDRLLLLRTSDKPGMESDEFELRIDDRDQAVALPARGSNVVVMMGYEGQGLARLGVYTVDEVELSGPPDTIVIRGKASDMRGSGSWENVPLLQIVVEIAKRNGWEVSCPVDTKVERIDQRNESDYNFVTRLAKQYDCTAKVAESKLLVMPRQSGQSITGNALSVITINKTDVSRYQFRLGDRNSQKAVKTQHQDPKTPRPASCRWSSWPTTSRRTACRQCTPIVTSTPTKLPPSRPRRLGWLLSIAVPLVCAWKWQAVRTCLLNAQSTPRASSRGSMTSTWWTGWSRCSPSPVGPRPSSVMAARRARPKHRARRRKIPSRSELSSCNSRLNVATTGDINGYYSSTAPKDPP